MTTDRKEEFYDRLKGIQAGMLQVGDRYLPMSPNLVEGDKTIWFITAKETPMAKEASKGTDARLVLSSEDKGLYADVSGHLSVSHDREKLDEVWNVVASSWFEDGKRDDDVLLVSYQPSSAEVWMSEGGTINFLYQMARAQITGKHPDLGSNFTLQF